MASCRKDVFLTDSSVKLSFSEDTLTFDTVFTAIGSATRYFKIYNRENKKIKISDIKLAGGVDSHFRINVDGIPGIEAKDVEIAANDSLYIFAAVTVDPNNDANPFVIEDSILFNTNGNNQKVILNAWGQNAHFYYDSIITADQHWINDLPYVIINSMLIDTNVTVTIDPGCQIYNHPRSYILVAGTLIVNGTKDDTVFFRGDRLENYFQDLPGQWGGIIFGVESYNSIIKYSTIQDADIGIWADDKDLTANTKVTLEQVIIKNMTYVGLWGFLATVKAQNLLVYNVGQNNCLQITDGGNYQFDNCTFANYSSTVINHQEPAVYLSNYYAEDNVIKDMKACNAIFNNCIIWGGLEQELSLDFIGTAVANATFNSCCVKTDSVIIENNPVNQDPLFINYSENNYQLSSGSPCINTGMTPVTLTVDITGYDRNLSLPFDIGAYEKH